MLPTESRSPLHLNQRFIVRFVLQWSTLEGQYQHRSGSRSRFQQLLPRENAVNKRMLRHPSEGHILVKTKHVGVNPIGSLALVQVSKCRRTTLNAHQTMTTKVPHLRTRTIFGYEKRGLCRTNVCRLKVLYSNENS